jgi:hypothetical protein
MNTVHMVENTAALELAQLQKEINEIGYVINMQRYKQNKL